MADLQMRSSAFNDHGDLPQRMSKPGGNVSPPLEWSGVPAGTEELVLICADPDAGPRPFLHWLVTDIDPQDGAIAEGQAPPGREWRNDFGGSGYGGPQPPAGDEPHRYFFRLYAVDRPLDLPEHPPADLVEQRAAERALASGTLVGTFAR